jgi:hypothetical protein
MAALRAHSFLGAGPSAPPAQRALSITPSDPAAKFASESMIAAGRVSADATELSGYSAHPVIIQRIRWHLMDVDLDLARIEEAARIVDPVFCDSPQFVNEQMCAALGRNVLVKVETANPLGSFKGRGADFLLRSLPPRRPQRPARLRPRTRPPKIMLPICQGTLGRPPGLTGPGVVPPGQHSTTNTRPRCRRRSPWPPRSCAPSATG